jgi:hypothetical protein
MGIEALSIYGIARSVGNREKPKNIAGQIGKTLTGM